VPAKPTVPPKPDGHAKAMELCAKSKKMNETYKELKNLASSKSSLVQVGADFSFFLLWTARRRERYGLVAGP
jgi:hypothetical protein